VRGAPTRTVLAWMTVSLVLGCNAEQTDAKPTWNATTTTPDLVPSTPVIEPGPPPPPLGSEALQTDYGEAPGLEGFHLESNPNNVLSCFAIWTTREPAASEVQFGVGTPQFRIAHEERTTEHRVLVIGLHAETEYLIRAVSRTDLGAESSDARFVTSRLPAGVPTPELLTLDPGAVHPGWTLTNIWGGDPARGTSTPAVLVMYDSDGSPVWYHINGTTPELRGDVSVDLIGDSILIGPTSYEAPREIDLAGNLLWQGPAQTTIDQGSPMSHQVSKLQNGNYLLLRDHPLGQVLGVLLEEVNADNQVLWSWNIFDHVPAPSDAPWDWCHANAVSVDLVQDVFFLSCRWLGVFKVHRSGDQNVIWHLGTRAGSPAGDFSYLPADSAFQDQHDPELHRDGTLLLYSNGGLATSGGTGYASRVVEYALEEDRRQATLVWEFPGAFDVDPWFRENWYTPFFGDADRLPNGNVLVTAGVRSETRSTHLFEVTRAGKVVWDIRLPANMASYRAQRLPLLVETLP
jgi:hypothetical protein